MTWDPRNNWNVDMVQPVNRLCPLNRGLVAWWLGIPGITGGRRFIDIASPGPNGNHGTLTNMDPVTGWIMTEHAVALELDGGSNQYVRVPESSRLDTPTGCSVSAWVFPTLVDGQKGIVESYDAADGLALRIRTANTLAFTMLISGGVSWADATVTADVWQHVVGTWDGSNNRIYLNGNLIDTAAHSGAVGHVSQDLIIGARGGGSLAFYFSGQISDAALHNRPLLPSEIKAIYLDSFQGYPRRLRRVGQQVFPAAVAVAQTMPIVSDAGIHSAIFHGLVISG